MNALVLSLKLEKPLLLSHYNSRVSTCTLMMCDLSTIVVDVEHLCKT